MYLNGRFVAPAEATVNALDRGNLFGDGVYEVIPVYSRHPFRLVEHLRRLAASLAAIELDNPHPDADWQTLILQAIALQPFDDQSVYVQVSRGSAGFRDFPFPADTPPTVMIYPMPLVLATPELKAQGVQALSHADFRWLRCDIKSLNLLPTVLMREKARRAACAEVLFFRDGWLTEGAASNIFMVKDGVIAAPPKSSLMLSGITYDVVIELAQAQQIPLVLRPIAEAEVRSADELWMTSSTREVLGIVALDGQPVGQGRVGPLTLRMDALYQDFKAAVMRKGHAS